MAIYNGNQFDNKYNGSDSADKIYGNDGNDNLDGSLGNDTLSGGNGNDTLKGGSDDDSITGGNQNDLILTGGLETDKLIDGGSGWDTISVVGSGTNVSLSNAFADIIRNVEAIDIRGSGSNKLSLTAQDVFDFNGAHELSIQGDSNDQVSIGNGWGKTGDAYVQYVAGLGQATLYIDGSVNLVGTVVDLAAANKLNGSAGADVLNGYGGNDTLLGSGGNDTLYGEDGKDVLDGGTGVDSMVGGYNDDTYVVDNVKDIIVESGWNYDTVKSSVDWTLAKQTESLVLTGSAGLTGTGNDYDNAIDGNDGANKLLGLKGNDDIFGGLGADNISGGDGNDSIEGGNGSDSISADAGNDTIVTGGVELDKLVDGGDGQDSIALKGKGIVVSLNSAFADTIRNVESIDLKGTGANTLSLTAQDVYNFNGTTHALTVSGDADDHLNIGDGWVNLGNGNYSQYIDGQGSVNLTVKGNGFGVSGTFVETNYTISDQASANNLSGFLDPHIAQTIKIDFGTKQYSNFGLTNNTINLSGFGKEDTLVIAQTDGLLHNGTAKYHADLPFKYITEYNGKSQDLVSWYNVNTRAVLVSKNSLGKTEHITLTGLPTGLEQSHFQFV